MNSVRHRIEQLEQACIVGSDSIAIVDATDDPDDEELEWRLRAVRAKVDKHAVIIMLDAGRENERPGATD